MRIATVPSLFSLQLKGQAIYMQQAGFEVHWVSGSERGWIKWPEKEKPNAIHQINFSRKANPFRDVFTLIQLYFLIRRIRPAIVHSHTPKGGLLGMWAAKLAGVKIRVHTIAGTPFSTASGPLKWIMKYAEQTTALAATEVWVNSPLLLEKLVSQKVLPSGKCIVLGRGASNGVNLDVFSRSRFNEQDEQNFRLQHNLEAHYQVLLFVGRLVSEKGIQELVDAFCRFHTDNVDYRLVLIGPFEPERDSLPMNTIKKIRQHPAIIHLLWSNEIPQWMYISRALILPSYREGLANVVLESAAMQCLLVVSSIDGNLNVVPDDAHGVLFELRSVNALYNAMARVAEMDSSDMESRTQKAYKIIADNYSQSKVHAQIAAAYQRLLGN